MVLVISTFGQLANSKKEKKFPLCVVNKFMHVQLMARLVSVVAIIILIIGLVNNQSVIGAILEHLILKISLRGPSRLRSPVHYYIEC